MDINGISQVMQANYESSKVSKDTEKKTTNDALKNEISADTAAAEYTKSEETSLDQAVKYDAVTIEKMKAEAELKTAQLRTLVEKMMLKQGEQFTTLSDAFDMIKEGTLEVDDEVVVEAQKEVSEDGYWGVNQTSERLVSFAKALAGNDPTKADSMIEALQRGFDAATEAWGGELPDLCKQTFEAAQKKLTEWRDSANAEADTEASTDSDAEATA
ncbi:MAG: hypothetical protein J6J42_14270 [Lachnospiraceae bacterium]|nr:hypothetical protein [Lachnospiraceae bacterium]